MDDEFEVVPDSMRRRYNHRGRPTPPVIEALLDGKTVRMKKLGGAAGTAKKHGFKLHHYTDKESGLIVAWFEKVVKP